MEMSEKDPSLCDDRDVREDGIPSVAGSLVSDNLSWNIFLLVLSNEEVGDPRQHYSPPVHEHPPQTSSRSTITDPDQCIARTSSTT